MKLTNAYERKRVIIYYIILYYIILYYIILYYIILYYIILYYIILYYIRSTPPTCFGHACGQPQRDTLHRITRKNLFQQCSDIR